MLSNRRGHRGSVLPVEQMGERIVRLARREPTAEKDTSSFEAIHRILRTQLGHDFSGYKQKTFGRRVSRRINVLELSDIASYVDKLKQSPDEVRLLFRDLLIGVTSFFRDPAAFDVLTQTVIPQLLNGKGPDDSVRIWVPGCSTGEEVYSIAILLREHIDTVRAGPKVQLFATDIDKMRWDSLAQVITLQMCSDMFHRSDSSGSVSGMKRIIPSARTFAIFAFSLPTAS